MTTNHGRAGVLQPPTRAQRAGTNDACTDYWLKRDDIRGAFIKRRELAESTWKEYEAAYLASYAAAKKSFGHMTTHGIVNPPAKRDIAAECIAAVKATHPEDEPKRCPACQFAFGDSPWDAADHANHELAHLAKFPAVDQATRDNLRAMTEAAKRREFDMHDKADRARERAS